MASQLGVAPADIDHRATFSSFGLGSLQAVSLAGDLESWLGRPLSATLAYEHPTIESLAQHLAGESSSEDPTDAPPSHGEPIAIVGIGCRFPGARGPEEFWHLLASGTDATRSVPEGRWPANGEAGKIDYRRGGFLDRVDLFDADFFGISPREAQAMDPQQRLLLEVAWEAMEDAGLRVESLGGSPVGVFVGISTDDYSRLRRGDHGSGDVYEITGNAASIAANRISYAFDFRGPSLAIDTACSSSLAAVEWACRSLRGGESSIALAGGVNLLISPGVSANFARAGFLASDGRCKTFSASADGYARGEGAGVVVLKPLTRALADGDTIYAVIRGGAINQDGRTNGLTAPSRQAQEAVLRSAYRAAGIEPGRVDYIEAHGTGTNLGDPIEATALGSVLGEGRPLDRPCRVGSVKTNIGHLEAAAGVAGLIKVALMFRHASIAPSLHAGEPNPQIPFDSLPLRVAGRPEPWPSAELPNVAGVSSFGFGGTNVHLVVEAAPDRAEDDGAWSDEDVLLPLSARGPEALRDLARAVRDALGGGADLRDLARTASLRRDHHDHRLAVVASSSALAVEGLDAFLNGTPDSRVAAGRRPPGRRPRLAVVFSGQGGMWWGAGRDLLEREPVFREVYEACDRQGVSLRADLSEPTPERLADPEFAQTHQFALQAALSALLGSWGIRPDAVVGHSLGEVAAAHAAGAIDLDEALRIVSLRGRLM
ncbi:MAG TPA: beta-ketoacyl synthase N-terminal-like domain-containing protein, partial [Isosphaeraceae bacterium]|nr:beta-ketoacyl synthase N-terminal-like domain-containing protein [Isosphaeraceae bacterium]